jgi:hypothetical protein
MWMTIEEPVSSIVAPRMKSQVAVPAQMSTAASMITAVATTITTAAGMTTTAVVASHFHIFFSQ